MNAKALLLFTALLVFTGVFTSYAQGVPVIKDVEVKVTFEPTCLAANGSSTIKADSRWMLITVTYLAETKGSSGKSSNPDWIDNLTLKFETLLPAIYQGKDVYSLMSGKVVLWAVPGDGERHKEVGFIPPQVLKRYARPGMKFSSTEAKNIEARVSFYNKDQQLLGRAYATRKGAEKEAAARFSRAETELGVLKLEDVILSRDKTPWAVVDFDFYDLIKAEGSK
ncbi:MAG: hypothetical protein A2X49_06370 [Lentisphaerae bacterium GWF2_52_8]|nr:MAG: hypothetical protein A2X49_06370 [Lentisphaerae bacterium GWF2_52_8]